MTTRPDFRSITRSGGSVFVSVSCRRNGCRWTATHVDPWEYAAISRAESELAQHVAAKHDESASGVSP